MFPASPDTNDPSDTSQIRYMPAARNKRRASFNVGSENENAEEIAQAIEPPQGPAGITFPGSEAPVETALETPVAKRLSSWNLFTLSVSMAGAQIAWSVELGYGTPFLLRLGLSQQLTSLVWLAGPVSGLIAQPLIGAISDSSVSKYRRRYWVIMATVVLVISTLILAFCEAIATFFVDILNVGEGDWDPKRRAAAADTAIGLAVVCFYFLDFALNALQASLRNLLLDITPPEQLNSGNAWHGRMTHAGNIIGFGVGFLPLDSPLLHWLGGDQFRKFCIVSMVILVGTVWTTCFCHDEIAGKVSFQRSRFSDLWINIRNAVVSLPKPIRRVCYVQLFAFMGWFPFLFYATTYIGQIMAFELDREPDNELAVRTGEFAMLIFSVVAVVAGTLLPYLANRDRRLLPRIHEDEDGEISRLRRTVRRWKAEAIRRGRPLRLPFMPFLLRNIWTSALVLYFFLMLMTFFVRTVAQASAIIGLTGICWAVACWVPFAIIMEYLKELESRSANGLSSVVSDGARPAHSRTRSHAPAPRREVLSERAPLITRSRSHDAYDPDSARTEDEKAVGGGTVLGIHNLAIVAPQFIVSVAASVIFKIVDGTADPTADPTQHNTYYGKNGVAWVLRFGGLCTLIGAIVSRGVAPTPAEKEMRRLLAEMKDLHDDDTP